MTTIVQHSLSRHTRQCRDADAATANSIATTNKSHKRNSRAHTSHRALAQDQTNPTCTSRQHQPQRAHLRSSTLHTALLRPSHRTLQQSHSRGVPSKHGPVDLAATTRQPSAPSASCFRTASERAVPSAGHQRLRALFCARSVSPPRQTNRAEGDTQPPTTGQQHNTPTRKRSAFSRTTNTSIQLR